MENDDSEPQRRRGDQTGVNYQAIAASLFTDDVERLAHEQRSALPAITTVIMKNLPLLSSTRPIRGAASKTHAEHGKVHTSPELAHLEQRNQRLASVLKFSVEWNQKLAYETHFDRLHINFSRPSGAPLEDEPRKTTPDLSDAAKVAAIRYAHHQAFSPLLADVVRKMQAEPRPSAVQAKKIPEDDWMMVAAEINQLAEEAGADHEEVDSFLRANPELQDEVDELIQVLDFVDPIQRAKIVNTMKVLTYLMFFAVIIGSWHLFAAYASLISLMGMTAPNVVKAVGDGTEKLLNKISPPSEEDSKD